MERIACILIGYGFGLFQTGYLYGRLKHIDIRQYGSGNAGTTNALRVLGRKAGIITYAGDALKAFFAGLLVRILFRDSHADMLTLLVVYAGLGVVLGHNYPFYLNFKGGKGIAATSGMLAAIDWRLALVCAAIFICVTAVSHYVSLGSLCMMTGFLIFLIIGGQTGVYGMSAAHRYELYAVGAVMTAQAFIRHKANIGRLLNGTENKLWGNKKETK